MRLGIIAYGSDTGLGNQTFELYRHMKPAKTLVINLANHNRMPVHLDRFPDAKVSDGLPNDDLLEWLTTDVDAIFVCETPLQFSLWEKCRQKGIVAIQQYNYEFLDYFVHKHWPKPTVLAAPTKWNIDAVRELAQELGIPKVVEWPVPVNRELIPFRTIEQCQTFVHIIGRPAVHDRNGTLTFLEAAAKIGRRAKYKIYVQPPQDAKAIEYYTPIHRRIESLKDILGIEVIRNVPNYADMYATGDVLVFPRRYGGLCLPVNEALSAGMPVIMTNISPNSDWLPPDWLVPARRIKDFYPRPRVDVYEADVDMLAYTMLRFVNSSAYMQQANKLADEIAESISWKTLKTKYDQLLREVCKR